MDLVNFKVGNKYVAFDILDILLTERYNSDLTNIPSPDNSFLGVKDFMDIPTPVFDLGIIMNNCSTKETNEALFEKFRSFEHEHIDWLNALENSIKNDLPFNHAINPKQTEFMKWKDSFDVDNEDLQSILERFEEPFQNLFAVLTPALNHKKNVEIQPALDDINRVRATYATQINRLFDSAKEQVEQSYKPIIVFTTKDGRTPYIGLLVDKVEDSVTINNNEIKSLNELMNTGFELNEVTKKMLRGMVKIGNAHSLIINPTAIFRPEIAESA
ncbi:chemotaxis protein [Flocculibacter collagenilyticus]|uniref:chemotaxis protein n=1 Tax=Flocculibacter collagenilyticus TaxID=2744479 RepID=UPI0018F372D8|nr:chemotaxis protein [Flocculibacter collagenilyticus]